MTIQVSYFLKYLLLIHFLVAVVALPTLGRLEHSRLETYEEVSDREPEELDDLFAQLAYQFSCEARPIGFYADPLYNCRIFHVCDGAGNGFPVICSNNTVFDQRERSCTAEPSIACRQAPEWFFLNELPYTEDTTEPYTLTVMPTLEEEKEEDEEEKEEVSTLQPLILP